jgi:uncharacterized membrane protein
MTSPPPAPAAHSSYRRPRNVGDVTRENVQAMRKLEQLAVTRRNLADRIAEFVARFCGSITFVWIHAALFTFWIGWNVMPKLPHFDPYPFTFLILCVSLEAIYLSAFILISQNYEMRISERRNQLDLQINLLAEQENTKMLQMLDRMARKLGVSEEDDAEVRVLEQATRPDKLADQIEKEFRERAGQHPGKPRPAK